MPATAGTLSDILKNGDAVFIVAKDDDRIIGVASLYVMRKIHKNTGSVEDVVVDEGYRGQGLGEKIMLKLIEVARAKGLQTLTLTSRPERVAGNKLYQKLGFVIKETNAYRLQL